MPIRNRCYLRDRIKMRKKLWFLSSGISPCIYGNNSNGDFYTRKIYHNMVNLPSDRAIVLSSGTTDVKNNIGPAITNNIAISDAYYVGKAVANYHLASGTAPINARSNLTSIVPTDIEGTSRLTNSPPDLGASNTWATGLPAPRRISWCSKTGVARLCHHPPLPV